MAPEIFADASYHTSVAERTSCGAGTNSR